MKNANANTKLSFATRKLNVAITIGLFFYANKVTCDTNKATHSKGGEIRDTKTLHLSRNIVSLQVFVDVSRFSPCKINLSRNKIICCGLKKVVAKSTTRVYIEQQLLVLLLVHYQTHNLSRNKFARALAGKSTNQHAAFLQPATNVFVARQVDHATHRHTSTNCKICNETMLRDKLKVFVSRISPP